MRITIINNAQLPKKYLRFIKWKLNNIKEKFKHLIYVEIFLNSEGQSPKTFIITTRLGIQGNDIILQNQSNDLTELFRKSSNTIHRYLAKSKLPKTNKKQKN